MKQLITDIHNCNICAAYLKDGVRPIIQVSKSATILIIGQAPGKKVHETGIPWNDPSGNQLRKWLGVNEETFYNPKKLALVPMGFCYPGKGKTGDLPPRKECAPKWHQPLLENMSNIKLTLLIGQYAQQYYLQDKIKANLTETVKSYKEYLPQIIPLPHPSPRNRFWLSKNPWFEEEVVPYIQQVVQKSF